MILLIGATGTVGREVVKQLVAAGERCGDDSRSLRGNVRPEGGVGRKPLTFAESARENVAAFR